MADGFEAVDWVTLNVFALCLQFSKPFPPTSRCLTVTLGVKADDDGPVFSGGLSAKSMFSKVSDGLNEALFDTCKEDHMSSSIDNSLCVSQDKSWFFVDNFLATVNLTTRVRPFSGVI